MLAADDPATGIPVHGELANPDRLLGVSKASMPNAKLFPSLLWVISDIGDVEVVEVYLKVR